MKRYLFINFVVIILISIGCMMISLWASTNCFVNIRLCQLVRFQTDKISNLPSEIDTIFLGDSTLAYSVDAELFSRLEGASAMSLALTGWNFNVPSYHNMLLRVLRQARVKNVVFVMTPQDFDVAFPSDEDPVFRGFIYTLGNDVGQMVRTIVDYPMAMLKRLLRAMTNMDHLTGGLKTLVGVALAPSCAACGVEEFLPQGPRVVTEEQRAILSKRRFGAATHRYTPSIRRIVGLCREYDINCIYLHGTLYKPVIENSLPMINEISEMMSQAGLKVGNSAPFEILDDEIGDGFNHIANHLKSAFTKRVHAALRGSLLH